jgi:Protein of unknown function (DUF3168)
MALEGHDICSLVWSLLVADSGPGGVNTALGGTAGVPGRIYQDVVPQAAALPAATVGLVAAPDTVTLGGLHVGSVVDVDVRVVAAGTSYGPIATIARRMTTVLDGAAGTADGTYAYKLRRIDLRRLAETDAGVSYRHLIATFRTEAHPVP